MSSVFATDNSGFENVQAKINSEINEASSSQSADSASTRGVIGHIINIVLNTTTLNMNFLKDGGDKVVIEAAAEGLGTIDKAVVEITAYRQNGDILGGTSRTFTSIKSYPKQYEDVTFTGWYKMRFKVTATEGGVSQIKETTINR